MTGNSSGGDTAEGVEGGTDRTATRARGVVERLRAVGHPAQADHFEAGLTLHTVESAVLFALREACETVLTAIEAIDPVTQTMVEELRAEVESRLRLHDEPK